MLNRKQKRKTALITGITGQDGSYLAKFLLSKKYRVVGLIRPGSNEKNLEYLKIAKKVFLKECDLSNLAQVKKNIKCCRPDEVYNLAAASSVKDSFSQPLNIIKFNTISAINLLEAIRVVNNKIKLYQASSSEMFGGAGKLPIKENFPLHPLSPYAASKAIAHLAVINYRQTYGLFAACGILFNHESFLREKNFFVKKVIAAAIAISQARQARLEVGNIDVKRDFGYSPKYVEAMWLMLQNRQPKDYIICSGKSVKLRDIISYVFKKLDIPISRLAVNKTLYRPAEIADIYGSCRKARKELGWNYQMNFFNVLDIIIKEELTALGK